MTDYKNMTLAELEQEGQVVGESILSDTSELPIIGDPGIEDIEDWKEAVSERFNEAEQNYRCFSPFEFFAKDLNERPDSEEAWESYEDGLRQALENFFEQARPSIREGKAEEDFENMLNDTMAPVSICGMHYDPGTALKQLDPVAFHQELLAYLDNEGMDLA